ncbi:radical SAM protein [Arthrobacter sp. CAU 1506]|uniref:4Fe-4S single cluster domain-containing protein n=1 Tax=Arthrobacter sp. CAU 1506 TaxID=2560052 RepID=UPI0010AB7694|nr:4Fe-4S single cluster domain-containing protein [Arthrobacter sp. CAU 1506]TJY72491.1 radical SAM protein [Arthrobacter sp. CAU 1506]
MSRQSSPRAPEQLTGQAPVPRINNGTVPPRTDAGAIRYARFLPATDAEGPGRRAALWLQGCSIRCPGCFNPHLWADRGAALVPTGDFAAGLVDQAIAGGSEGLTLLGGEPFEQAAASAVVARSFRDAGLSVMTFTGYHHRDLKRWAEEREDIAGLLAATDLLADGPYLQDRPDLQRPWIGSTNQGLTALTSRYRDLLKDVGTQPDRIEIRVAPDGTIGLNGWASDDQLDALLADLGTRADRPGSGSAAADRPRSGRSTASGRTFVPTITPRPVPADTRSGETP